MARGRPRSTSTARATTSSPPCRTAYAAGTCRRRPGAGGQAPVAVLLLGLDAFNEVDPDARPRLRGPAAARGRRRLDEAGRDQDLVARFGGDEFAVLTGPLTGMDEAERLAHELLDALRPQARRRRPRARRRSGSPFIPRDGSDAELLLVRAAMTLAPRASRTRPPSSSTPAPATTAARAPGARGGAGRRDKGRRAAELSPKLDLRTAPSPASRRSVRWRHPQHGVLMPTSSSTSPRSRARPATDPPLDARWPTSGSAPGVNLTVADDARAPSRDLPSASRRSWRRHTRAPASRSS